MVLVAWMRGVAMLKWAEVYWNILHNNMDIEKYIGTYMYVWFR